MEVSGTYPSSPGGAEHDQDIVDQGIAPRGQTDQLMLCSDEGRALCPLSAHQWCSLDEKKARNSSIAEKMNTVALQKTALVIRNGSGIVS